jgi:hypothetical protein
MSMQVRNHHLRKIHTNCDRADMARSFGSMEPYRVFGETIFWSRQIWLNFWPAVWLDFWPAVWLDFWPSPMAQFCRSTSKATSCIFNFSQQVYLWVLPGFTFLKPFFGKNQKCTWIRNIRSVFSILMYS